MVQLICEGACNPNIAALDLRVRELVNKKEHAEPVGDAFLWDAQRTLRHTRHEMQAPLAASCCDCGHVRRYGSE